MIGSGNNVNINRPINVDRNQINNRFNNRYNNINDRPFSRGWYGGRGYAGRNWYPWRPGYRSYRSGYWWGACTATALTGWFVNAWSTPTYYSYGTGGNVYYENNAVYVNGQQYASADQYYEQAVTIADNVPKIDDAKAEEMEWMPLGVFALTKEGVNDSNMLLQLAVSKDGIIAGTFYNESTEASRPVEGTVDRDTQRAAWHFADGKNSDVVMETGVYNLTEDESQALVHFGAEKTQDFVMVRLDEPDEQQSQGN